MSDKTMVIFPDAVNRAVTAHLEHGENFRTATRSQAELNEYIAGVVKAVGPVMNSSGEQQLSEIITALNKKIGNLADKEVHIAGALKKARALVVEADNENRNDINRTL